VISITDFGETAGRVRIRARDFGDSLAAAVFIVSELEGVMIRKLWVLLVVVLLAPAVASAAPITSLYVFGDSLSDQGNGFILTGGFPPAPYAQRASNGPVAVERLAADLGIALAPAALGGTNYAVVGAATGLVLIPGSSPPAFVDNIAAISYGQPALLGTSLLNQVAEFLLTGPVIDPAGSLFFVWGGANDFSINPSAQTAVNAATNIATAINALYLDGARQFLVPNLPDLSRTPYGQALPPFERAGLQALTVGFNNTLAAALSALSGLPGIDITTVDTFALVNTILANPGAFGFSNVSSPCLTGDFAAGAVICPNPGTFVFWDSLHPTTAAHGVLGDAFARAVPEPATLTLVGLGMALTAAVRRRRT
jgi:outer membrane lipase/esterase